MSLPVLSNRSGHPVRIRLVLGTVILLSGCARGPRWGTIPRWGYTQVRVESPDKKTRRSGDDAVGPAAAHRSIVARSGNVFTALINRRQPGEGLSDDPFLDAPLAHAGLHSSHLVNKDAARTRSADPRHSSLIRQVNVKPTQDRSQPVGDRIPPSVASSSQPSRRRHRNEAADWPSVENTALAADHDQMDRLRTAMKSNRRETVLSDQTGARAAKAHVSHMMRDVHALRREGKLSEAYRTALSAREFAKISRLFYGPDEEQPGDLVHQLRGELRAVGHKIPAKISPLSTARPQPAVAGPDRSPTELPARRRLTNKPLRALPFPEFIPPERSLLVNRTTDRTSSSGGSTAAGQMSDEVALVNQMPSERVEILSPAPKPNEPESNSPSQTTELRPGLPTQPMSTHTRRLTNRLSSPSIQSHRSDRPLIVPDRRTLPKRTETGYRQSPQRDQTTAGQIRQTTMTDDNGVIGQASAQRGATLSDAPSLWNRTAEPAVLLSSVLSVPSDTAPVRSANRRLVHPAPAPPVERSHAAPTGDTVRSSSNKTPDRRVVTEKGSPSATLSLESVDWNDHASIDDDPSAGSRRSLLWLTLAIMTGVLLGVCIRTWTRFRGKPVDSRDS